MACTDDPDSIFPDAFSKHVKIYPIMKNLSPFAFGALVAVGFPFLIAGLLLALVFVATLWPLTPFVASFALKEYRRLTRPTYGKFTIPEGAPDCFGTKAVKPECDACKFAAPCATAVSAS
jgi:hypothetical protein